MDTKRTDEKTEINLDLGYRSENEETRIGGYRKAKLNRE